MNSQMHLWAKGFFFPFGLNQQVVRSGIQVRISDDGLATRTVPVVGEAFQFVNNFIFIGCHVVGSGKFNAEHGLVCVQGDLLGMA